MKRAAQFKNAKTAQKFIDFDMVVTSVTKDAAGECIIEGFANTSTKDRVGDVVLPAAFEQSLPTYMSNPVLLENHNWDRVAGVTLSAEVRETGLFIRARVSDTRADLKTQIREGCLRTFSIGYNELDADFDDSTKTKIVKNLELLEISIVSVPANPEAKFVQVDGDKPAPDAQASADDSAGKTDDDQKSAAGSKTKISFKDFIATVKDACGVNDLDNETVIACCDYFTSNEETMTKAELIALLRSKSAPKPAAKADAKPAGDPAPAEGDKPAAGTTADAAAGPDAGDQAILAAVQALGEKLGQIADAVAQLLEGQSDDDDSDEDDSDDSDADAEKAGEKCKECGEQMTKDDSGKPACPKGHAQPDAQAAEGSDADAQKSVQEMEAEIAALHDQIAQLEG